MVHGTIAVPRGFSEMKLQHELHEVAQGFSASHQEPLDFFDHGENVTGSTVVMCESQSWHEDAQGSRQSVQGSMTES